MGFWDNLKGDTGAMRLAGIGQVLSALDQGQTPNVAPYLEAIGAQKQTDAFRQSLQSDDMMGKFSAEERSFLATLPPQLAQNLIAERLFAQSAPVNLQTFTGPDGMVYSFNPQTGETAPLTGAKPGGPNGAAKRGLNPQYGVDANGNPVLLQLGEDGTAVQTAMPEGVTLSREPIKLDAGTHYVLLDPITRQPVGQVPKDLAGAESEKAQGKAQGEAAAALPGAYAEAEHVIGLVDELIEDPYLKDMVGPVQGRLPNMSADAARVQSKMDQVTGQGFMAARQFLKGQGQITDFESRRAEAAMTRMNAAQSYDDYVDALREFQDAVRVGVLKAELAAGQSGGGQSPAQPPAKRRTWTPDGGLQ